MTVLDVTQDPYNAVPDGETDTREAIQQAIEDASDGDTVYLPAGTYGVTENSYDPHWGNCLYIGGNKEGVSWSFEGDGKDTVIKALSSENMIAITPGEADSGKLDIDFRNFVIDGNGHTAGRGIDINQGWTNSGVEAKSGGHSIHFENILIRDTDGTGLQMRGDDAADVGVGTVTATNLTVKNTYDGHGISLTSAVQTSNKSEVNNIFESVKCVDIGNDTGQKGNGINCDGSHLVRNFWFENCKRGNKISGGGTNSFFENGTFANNIDTDQSAFRETIAGEWNDPWKVQMDNVRFDNISTSAYRMGGRDDQPGTTIFGEVEFNNIDEGGPEDDFILLFEDVHSLIADTIHVYNSGGDFPAYDWSGSELTINELNSDSEFSGFDSAYDVGTWNDSASSTTLDVPAKDEVGAFTGSTSSEPSGTTYSTDFSDETVGQTPSGWSTQWESEDAYWEVADSGQLYGNRLVACRPGTGNYGKLGLSWDAVGQAQDIELLGLVQVPQPTEANTWPWCRLQARGQGAAGNESGYFTSIGSDGGNEFRIEKYVDGSANQTLYADTGVQYGAWYWVRFRVSGENLKMKYWQEAESEPSAWDAEVTDTDVTGEGWAGIGQFSEHEGLFDYVSVGTNGASAPLPETDTSNPDDGTTQPPLFDDWTPQWDSSQDDWSVVSGSEYLGGYALAFEHDGTDRTRYALAWDQLGDLSDVEIVDKFRVPAFTSDSNLGYHSRVHLRSSGSTGSESGYWIEVEAPENAFRLAKYTNGDLSTIGRFGTPQENTFFYRRFRAEGTTLKAKVWPAEESEPSGWDIETTDSDHASGWVGLGSFDTELVETDMYSVATGGDTAPLPGVDNAPELSWVAPTDGATVSGSTTVQIDASDTEDSADSLLVEYRLDDGSWAAASYNAETGYYEGSWDTTTVSDGDHTLEASVSDSAGNTTNAAITVTTDNAGDQPSIDTLSLSEVETDSSDAEFDVSWQVADADGNLATVDLVLFQDSDGSREDELSVDVSGETASDVSRLVASGDDGSANSYTVELTVTDADGNTASGANSATESEDSGSAPVINRFNVSEAGRPDPHADVMAIWDVTDTDGDLETVDIEVADSSGTVQGVTWTVTGASASDSDSFKIKEGDGQSFDVTITVTDAAGESSSETKSVTA